MLAMTAHSRITALKPVIMTTHQTGHPLIGREYSTLEVTKQALQGAANSTKASSKVDPVLDRALGSRPIQKWDLAASAVTWSTPRKAVDLDNQLAQYSQLDQPSSTRRLLFRKVKKGFEEKDY